MHNNNHPNISVVMPVYNRQNFVSEAVESILRQTYTDFEFIIVDDGSTDDSLKIIKQYANKDPRIRVVVNQHNMGIAKTRNIGIDLAQGKFIAFMDSDDISLPMRFEKQINFLTDHPEISAVGTQAAFINANKERVYIHKPPQLPIDVRWSLISRPTIENQSMMTRSDIFKTHGYRHNDLLTASDFDLWARISKKFLIANLPEILIFIRTHPDRISKNRRLNQHNNIIATAQRNVKQMTGIKLTEDQMNGFRYHSRIKNIQDAIFLSGLTIKLQKAALSWSDKKADQKRIKQLAASRLRSLWKSQNRDIRLLPYAAYSFLLEPATLRYIFPRFR